MIITKDMIDSAAARYAEQGFDFKQYTEHRIAHYLMSWDEAFKAADYTTLVSLVSNWKRGRALR
jgi:hypothetical protein